eukprot:CAMPEP_0182834816 /NCGR_PEP_ID=MMETSP0006_2-20121128/21140_1 /TAXON_ID=97485 /ORGANISM="Prymnesium parvum, Strain Texoma1" /LENGTH=115 /DNA_ID=CAMNT_0024963135 /DNA_START=563 /DNA_END=907 /DNA_ORIENTATION=+
MATAGGRPPWYPFPTPKPSRSSDRHTPPWRAQPLASFFTSASATNWAFASLVSLGVVEMTYRASARNEFSQQLAQQFIAAMTPGGVALLQGHARRKLCDQSHMLGMECSPAAVQA